MAETKNIEVSKIKALKIFGAVVLLSLIIINLASALVVLDSLSQEKLYPGKGAEIVLKLKNNFDDDVLYCILYRSPSSSNTSNPHC